MKAKICINEIICRTKVRLNKFPSVLDLLNFKSDFTKVIPSGHLSVAYIKLCPRLNAQIISFVFLPLTKKILRSGLILYNIIMVYLFKQP